MLHLFCGCCIIEGRKTKFETNLKFLSLSIQPAAQQQLHQQPRGSNQQDRRIGDELQKHKTCPPRDGKLLQQTLPSTDCKQHHTTTCFPHEKPNTFRHFASLSTIRQVCTACTWRNSYYIYYYIYIYVIIIEARLVLFMYVHSRGSAALLGMAKANQNWDKSEEGISVSLPC